MRAAVFEENQSWRSWTEFGLKNEKEGQSLQCSCRFEVIISCYHLVLESKKGLKKMGNWIPYLESNKFFSKLIGGTLGENAENRAASVVELLAFDECCPDSARALRSVRSIEWAIPTFIQNWSEIDACWSNELVYSHHPPVFAGEIKLKRSSLFCGRKRETKFCQKNPCRLTLRGSFVEFRTLLVLLGFCRKNPFVRF